MATNPLRRVVIHAAREFNAGRYFEAHEVLEDGLDDAPDELWDLLVGLIQIAVGYHKLTLQLTAGARRMLQSGLDKIAVFPGTAGEVNLEAIRGRVQVDLGRLRAGTLDLEAFARDPPRLQPLA